jgi:hypothetical protein
MENVDTNLVLSSRAFHLAKTVILYKCHMALFAFSTLVLLSGFTWLWDTGKDALVQMLLGDSAKGRYII